MTVDKHRSILGRATGIYWDDDREKWRVFICTGRRLIWLGSYYNKSTAIVVRKRAEAHYSRKEKNSEQPSAS